MFIIVFLLTLLSIPRVLLKPTLVESGEFDDTVLDDETRAKRQAQFFELLHQAIEKYANCANEHLAPLRALANYKQYETFVYPEGYSQSSQPIVGATNNRNKPKVKCTKVNLCSIQQPQAHSKLKYNSKSPTLLGRPQEPKTQVAQANRRYFPYNPNVRLPSYGSNRPRNMPPAYSPVSKNFTYFPFNRTLFNQLLYGPSLANRKGIIITPTQNPKDETINTKPGTENKSCDCTKRTTENPPTTHDNLKQETPINSENKQGTEKSSTTTTTTEAGPIVGSIQDQSAKTIKPKSCGCLKKTTSIAQTQPILTLTSTERDPLLGKSNDKISASKQIHNFFNTKLATDKLAHIGMKDPYSNQNLNLLFLQLDIMAHNESKEDLKQILQKLNALKSALKITESTDDKTKTTKAFSTSTMAPISTTSPTTLKSTRSTLTTTKVHDSPLVGAKEPELTATTIKVQESSVVTHTEPELLSTTVQAQQPSLLTTKDPDVFSTTMKIQESTQTSTKEPEIVTKIVEDLNKIENQNNVKTLKEAPNLQLHKPSNLNNAQTKQTEAILKTENSKKESNENIVNNTPSTPPIKTTLKSEKNSSPLLKAIEDFSQKLNLNQDEDITAVTSSPPLQLNITSSKDLARITNQMHTIVTSTANKTSQGSTQQQHNKSGDVMIIKKTITNKKTFSTNNANITIPHVVPNTLKHTNNGSFSNSTITISISSNGSFKKVQVEQQTPSDKNLEINEKENMNMGNSKIHSIDMKATDSRYVKYIQNPQRKDSYTEPILSEIYPVNSKSKTKPPLSLYWHKIEEKPLKAKQVPNKVFKIFQSDDYDDDEDENEDNDSEAEENLSILLKECNDFDDITDYDESDSEEDDHKTRFRDLCRHITYLT
ncbi:FK506-binding protein 5-like [Lucilia sericata]|uniref:FK506-binding protein 5-like n=1 Tax=Lucilia sericata TaxID=13632 RepID=UPI0018A80283|nr:FK506-binding protein 5-like [Lucilia sericata]